MRIHRLEIQAFGPFRGRQVVDVDALTDGGLFLLHGPTGAGKTSVLDAVCFALYGRVPGARSTLTRLRSDHAEANEAPQVVCEFSVGPRRFEVSRSPAWERPKKRGGGTTTEQARVLVRERVDGEWEPLAMRIDEAALLLDDVLGMGPDQFTKIVLLPQGEFAAFLRADADSRRALLERLFGTDRYAAVQDWLREQRASVRTTVEEAQGLTTMLLARAEQAALAAGVRPAAEAAEGRDAADGRDAPGGQDAAAQHLDRLSTAVARALEDVVGRREVTRSAVARARSAHERASAAQARLGEYARLVERREALDAAAPQRSAAERALADAGRAAALAPMLAPLTQARQRHESAALALVAARAAAGASGDDPLDPVALREQARRGREDLARLAAVEPEARELAALERTAATVARELEAAAARRDLVRARLTEHETRAVDGAAAATRAQALADGADQAQAVLDGAREVAAAVVERDRLVQEVALADGRLTELDRLRNSAWEHWLDLRERRLAGFAAELATTLVEGEPCRVCGSAHHPAPSLAAAAPVSQDDEAAARAAHEARSAEREAAAQALAATQARLAASVAIAGTTTVRAAADALAAADDRLAGARAAALEATALRDAQAQAQAAAGVARAELAEADTALETLRARAGRLAERLDGTRRRVTEALTATAASATAQEEAGRPVAPPAGEPAAHRVDLARDLVTVRVGVEQRCQSVDVLLTALDAVDRAAAHRDEVERAATAAALESGFASLETARAAVLNEADLTRLRDVVRTYDDERAAVADRLTALGDVDPEELSAWRSGALGSPAALADEVEQAHLLDEAAAAKVGLCESAHAQVGDLATTLRAHLDVTRPLLARFHTLDELTRCVEGTGGDNTRRMALSAYVLAARLEQVAQAATLRLEQMSGGRYGLAHSDGLERGRGRSGLSLEIVDAWTGARRETSSLSGGESFYTSLALALGLADVVASETGGAAIDTLFVDEGFGSLDEDTLEEVMTVLDGLRTGGRCVGVVSHVADLRHRIPSQLEVVRSPEGSTLRLRTG